MKRAIAAACTLAALGASAAADDLRYGISTGVDYSSGDFGGTEDTEVTAVRLAGRISTGDWSFRVSVPYLHIEGPATVSVTDGDVVLDGASTRTGSESGLGDISLSATRSFENIGGSHAYVDTTARVRLPTGDEDKGLGVGETDYALVAEIGHAGDVAGVFVDLGYRWLGDSAGNDRNDGATAGVGGWYDVADRTSIGASVNWREAAFSGNDDPAEASVYVAQRVSDAWKVRLEASAGLSDGSPDYGLGVRFLWRSRKRDH